MSAARLRDERFNGYLEMKIPHPMDTEVEAVVVAYVAGTASVRESIVDELDDLAAWALCSYGRRMAAVAVRTRSVDVLRRGVVAVGLAAGRHDFRDDLVTLSAVDDSASLVGTSLGTLIEELEDLLPPDGLELLQIFDGRPEDGKSLKEMGIKRSGAGESFYYAEDW